MFPSCVTHFHFLQYDKFSNNSVSWNLYLPPTSHFGRNATTSLMTVKSFEDCSQIFNVDVRKADLKQTTSIQYHREAVTKKNTNFKRSTVLRDVIRVGGGSFHAQDLGVFNPGMAYI